MGVGEELEVQQRSVLNSRTSDGDCFDSSLASWHVNYKHLQTLLTASVGLPLRLEPARSVQQRVTAQ